ncbi:BON domain-containing protein [uncultured Salinisphaera sp.]|uniref:BON domain-containing protein n=1 Tax=uncultured Salinisphaera sp. TaxID=359372 RepID=UPI0032B0F799|tara:strand:- start:320 stop:898 length:579 start_codon:yes stop_codon:yes gene_type:complete
MHNLLRFEPLSIHEEFAMRRVKSYSGVVAAAALVSLFGLAGCSQSPQEQYDAAVEAVNEAQSEISDARDKVKTTNEKIAEARKDHQKAQAALDDKQDRLREARTKAQKQASDEILFRVLQRDVLTKEAFEKSAISVSVDQRVVTLTGTVADAETRDRAVKLVRNQPGVADVRDQLQLQGNSANDGQQKQNAG